MASEVITILVPTPLSSTEINYDIQQPKNHVSDRKLLTLLGMPAGLHNLTKESKDCRKAEKQGQEGS